MAFEVENKFPVSDPPKLRRRIEALGAVFRGRQTQSDSYFNHPSRDFRQSGEAFRVRISNGSARLTYKGPRSDESIKIREEIELHLASDARAELTATTMLERLGFRFVACVRKQRDVFELARGKWSMEISLDEVNELGTFAEIELLVADGQQQLAKQLVIELQRELDLSEPIKSSYLSMLLAIKPEAATRPP